MRNATGPMMTAVVGLLVAASCGDEKEPGIPANTPNASQGGPGGLVFRNQPNDAFVGVSMSPIRVAIEDSEGASSGADGVAVTLELGEDPAGATLLGSTTVASTAGVATFSELVIDAAGDRFTLVASAPGFESVTSRPFAVHSADGNLIFVRQPPADLTAGASFDVELRVEDESGAPLTQTTGDVTLGIASGPEGGTLAGTLVQPLDRGAVSFQDLSVVMAGAYTLVASAEVHGSVESETMAVGAAAPFELRFVRRPTHAQAGSPMAPGPKVAVLDEFGNRALGANQPISLTLERGHASLQGTPALVPIEGVATFDNLIVTEARHEYTLMAHYADLLPEESSPFAVYHAGPVQIQLSAPGEVTAGSPFVLWVSAADEWGNMVHGYVGTVVFASSDSAAIVPDDYAFTLEDAGDHTFVDEIVLNTPGEQTITVTDTSNSEISGSIAIEVTPAL